MNPKYMREYRKKQKIYRRKMSLCDRCGKRKPRANLLTCKKCAEEAKIYCATVRKMRFEDRPIAVAESLKKNKRCACCGSKKHNGRGWHIDHEHKSKRFRGILCNNCNIGLGQFKDSIRLLKLAILYLEKPHDPTAAGTIK